MSIIIIIINGEEKKKKVSGAEKKLQHINYYVHHTLILMLNTNMYTNISFRQKAAHTKSHLHLPKLLSAKHRNEKNKTSLNQQIQEIYN